MFSIAQLEQKVNCKYYCIIDSFYFCYNNLNTNWAVLYSKDSVKKVNSFF